MLLNWLRISGTAALTSSAVIPPKKPDVRSFWPISNVYRPSEKYSSFGNNPLKISARMIKKKSEKKYYNKLEQMIKYTHTLW